MTLRAPQWLRIVSGPNGLSLPGWLVLGIPSIVASSALLEGGIGQRAPSALLWGVLAWLAIGAVWLVARLTWMSGGSTARRQILILPTYALGGVARTLVLTQDASFDRARTSAADAIIIAALPLISVVIVTLLSVVIALVVDRLRTLNLATGRLEVLQAGLIDAGARAARESAQLRSYARETILAALRQALGSSQDALSVAQSLRNVSDQVVRPLSHDLAAPAPEPVPTWDARAHRDLPSLARAILDARPVRPVLTTALYVAFAMPIAFYLHGIPRMFLYLAIAGACMLAMLGLATLIPWGRLPTAAGTALLAVVFLVTGPVSVLVLRVGPTNVGPWVGGTVYAAVLLLVIGGGIATVRGLSFRQAQIEEGLIIVARSLSDVVRREQASLRRERRHLARVLHGAVQPRLVARALQLQCADGPIDVRTLEREVASLLSEGSDRPESVDLARALDDVAEVWADTVDIRVDVPEHVADRIRGDASCALAISEVACEAVNNAVLRGGARRVEVSIRAEKTVVRLAVVNEVDELPRGLGSPGLGSATYDELADAWTISVEGRRVTFDGEFSVEGERGVIADKGVQGGAGEVRTFGY